MVGGTVAQWARIYEKAIKDYGLFRPRSVVQSEATRSDHMTWACLVEALDGSRLECGLPSPGRILPGHSGGSNKSRSGI